MSQPYDLEDRTSAFAQATRQFVRQLPKPIANVDDVKQLGRATGSVAATYIEANEAISKKDFHYRIKICRKEARKVVCGCDWSTPSAMVV